MRIRFGATVLAGVLTCSHAEAAKLDLDGRAEVGSADRAVSLRVSCEPADRAIALALTIPEYEDLARRFDITAFEGPSGSDASLTQLRVVGAAGVRTARLRVSGAVSADHPTRFVLTASPARRGEAPVRDIAAALVEPGAKLVWTQRSPRVGDAELVATVTMPEAKVIPLATALRPCLPERP